MIELALSKRAHVLDNGETLLPLPMKIRRPDHEGDRR